MQRKTNQALHQNHRQELDSASALANQLLFNASIRAEKYLAYTRFILILTLLVRLFPLKPPWLSILITISTVCVVVVFNLLYFTNVRRTHSKNWMAVSILMDACLGFTSLFNYVLADGPGRHTMMYLPDAVFLLTVCYANGFRLQPSLAFLSGMVNLLFFSLVIGLDAFINSPHSIEPRMPLSMWWVSIVSITTVAVITAVRAKNLLTHGIRESMQNQQLQLEVKNILQTKRDARQRISSVYLNADRLINTISKDNRGSFPITKRLKEELQNLTQCLKPVLTDNNILRTYETIETIDLGATVSKYLVPLLPLGSSISIEIHLTKDSLPIAILGGEVSMKQMLSNLLEHTAEANDHEDSHRIRVHTSRKDQRAWLVVEDNGLGFIPLKPNHIPATNNSADVYVGLFRIIKQVESSHGQIQFEDSSLGGAKVTLSFPLSTK